MKINMPVTDKEILVRKDQILVTRTDLKGRITYANNAFVAVSGFSREELLGSNHNIIRHPNVPEVVFEDLWSNLKQGRPWTATLKNRAKSGDFYWVEANICPVYKNGEVNEYLSVRYAPSRDSVNESQVFFDKLNAQQVSYHPSGWAALINRINDASISLKIGAGLALLSVPIFMYFYQLLNTEQYSMMAELGIPMLLALIIFINLTKDINSILDTTVFSLYRMADGKFKNQFNLDREGLVGDLLRGIYTMQVNLNWQLADSRQQARDALRINHALDNVQSGVMVTNANFNIIYMNRAVQQIFKLAEPDIRTQLPDFDADKLLGRNIDSFHKNPAHQRHLLEKLNAPFRSEFTLVGHHMSVIASPVVNEAGECVGYVAEWLDRTVEIEIEKEISKVIDGAALGDFSQRIEESGKQGFELSLAQSINQLTQVCSDGLNELVHMLEMMADGNLAEKITSHHSGMFGQLRDDANTTAENLREVITQILNASDAIYTASREIASGNSNLSERTEEQAASLEQTAASMEQLTSTVKANSQSAQHASELAVDASNIAAKGVSVVGEVVSTMEAINQSSLKIADIISVIDDIAFQTNILALNAAVEAARAGDKGKGFAVVAVEVRNLAQRAAKAAGEIKVLIQDSVGKVQDGTKLVSHAGTTMQEIVTSIRGVTETMSEIAAASAEQGSGIEQVNQAISQMDDVTQQNAALVEQATAAAESLEEQAQNLSTTVGHFKLGVNRHRPASTLDHLPKPLTTPSTVAVVKPIMPTVKTVSKQTVDNDEWEEF